MTTTAPLTLTEFREPLTSINFTGTGPADNPDYPTRTMTPTDFVGTWDTLPYRDAVRAARSTDPYRVVLALRSAAHSTWANREGITLTALRNPACPSAVAAFALRYWDLSLFSGHPTR
jgi:hypothetical protein